MRSVCVRDFGREYICHEDTALKKGLLRQAGRRVDHDCQAGTLHLRRDAGPSSDHVTLRVSFRPAGGIEGSLSPFPLVIAIVWQRRRSKYVSMTEKPSLPNYRIFLLRRCHDLSFDRQKNISEGQPQRLNMEVVGLGSWSREIRQPSREDGQWTRPYGVSIPRLCASAANFLDLISIAKIQDILQLGGTLPQSGLYRSLPGETCRRVALRTHIHDRCSS